MDIKLIRIYCDVVELQNFSRVAEKYGISQSAVSQQLAQFEMIHKTQFINRKKRPLEPTRAGEMLYQACKDIIARYDKFTSDLATLSKSVNRINIAAIFSVGMHALQPYVKKFMSKYPLVGLRIEYCGAEEIYERVLKGELDIGVVAIAKKTRHIRVYPFENEPLVLVCNPKHSFASFTTIDIHQLQGKEFVAFDKEVPTRKLIDSILNQYGVTVRTTLEFDNTETIKRAVEISSGVSILPEATVKTELLNGTLKAISFSNEKFYRPTSIIVRKDKTFSQAGRYLMELLGKEQQREADSD